MGPSTGTAALPHDAQRCYNVDPWVIGSKSKHASAKPKRAPIRQGSSPRSIRARATPWPLMSSPWFKSASEIAIRLSNGSRWPCNGSAARNGRRRPKTRWCASARPCRPCRIPPLCLLQVPRNRRSPPKLEVSAQRSRAVTISVRTPQIPNPLFSVKAISACTQNPQMLHLQPMLLRKPNRPTLQAQAVCAENAGAGVAADAVAGASQARLQPARQRARRRQRHRTRTHRLRRPKINRPKKRPCRAPRRSRFLRHGGKRPYHSCAIPTLRRGLRHSCRAAAREIPRFLRVSRRSNRNCDACSRPRPARWKKHPARRLDPAFFFSRTPTRRRTTTSKPARHCGSESPICCELQVEAAVLRCKANPCEFGWPSTWASPRPKRRNI